ncbi:ABC transporter ATP-binding protein [Chloroflexota bacterium]
MVVRGNGRTGVKPEMLLEVRNIKVFYEGVAALKGVSLGLMEGEVISLIGANGAGKTTILRAISGLKRIASGSIYFEGERIDCLAGHKIVEKGIIHVPEGKQLFGDMTVLENLKMGGYLYSDDEVKQTLESVFQHFPALEERKGQHSSSLSGGEQQMLAIGRGLMAQPKVLLLDEPSVGLSPVMVDEIAKIIKIIEQEGKISIILVEQNAQLALELTKSAYVIETGTIVLSGNIKEMMETEEIKRAYLGG